MVGDEEEQEARSGAGCFGHREPVALRHLVDGRSRQAGLRQCTLHIGNHLTGFFGSLSVDRVDD
jgi:hypothetical protein